MQTSPATEIIESITADKVVDVASELIKIPSFRPNETAVAEWIADYFNERGYEVEKQEVDPGRFQTIARLKGSGGGKSLMFNGHIDIDALSQGWKRDPWVPTVEGDRLYGAGIANMKGGHSSMFNAVEAIRTSGVRLKGDVVIACVAGHGDGGWGTLKMLERGIRADMAVVPEPYGERTLVTVHSGVAQMTISTIGYAQHSSRREYGIDAIAHMELVIDTLRRMKFTCTPRPDLPELPISNIGAVAGGKGREYKMTVPAFCADYCTIFVDVRYLPDQTEDSIRADITTALDRLAAETPNLKYELKMPADRKYNLIRIPFYPTEIPVSEPIVQTVARYATQVTGKPPETVGAAGPSSYTGMTRATCGGQEFHAFFTAPGGSLASITALMRTMTPLRSPKWSTSVGC